MAVREKIQGAMVFSLRDTIVSILILMIATGVCMILRELDDGDIFVSMIFLFGVALISRLTDGFFYGIAASVISVLLINFAFTYPYYEFCLNISGYPLAFVTMLAVSLLISGMTSQIKQQEKRYYSARVEQMRANLLRAVSHDLRTPLTSISGAASILKNHLDDMDRESQKSLLGEISDDADWLIRMVENLLSITRINADRASVIKRPEAAEEILSEAVRKYRKRFENPKVEICLPSELLLVPMDPILIEQVVTNLLENAALHAQGATRIRLSVRELGGEAVFEVEDNGCGIAQTLLPVLFEPKAASDNDASRNSRNMGIGLSVCRTIILAHGGRMTAENRLGGGARFRFTLPLEGEENHDQTGNHSDR